MCLHILHCLEGKAEHALMLNRAVTAVDGDIRVVVLPQYFDVAFGRFKGETEMSTVH